MSNIIKACKHNTPIVPYFICIFTKSVALNQREPIIFLINCLWISLTNFDFYSSCGLLCDNSQNIVFFSALNLCTNSFDIRNWVIYLIFNFENITKSYKNQIKKEGDVIVTADERFLEEEWSKVTAAPSGDENDKRLKDFLLLH